MSPCDSLPHGHREICKGTSGHSLRKRHAYLMQWLGAGKIERLPDGYAYEPESQTPKMPSIARRAANYGKAQAKRQRAKITGKPVDASPEVIAARKAICDGCELNVNGVCRHSRCGCVLSAKQAWLTERCPLGKWPE